MAILNNVPTLSYISWKDMIITYDDQSYQIQNSYTNKPYIYWDYNKPYELVTSNTMLKEMAGRYYICFNEKGLHTLIPQTDIEISFSEYPANDLVTERILGFKADQEANGERFTTIETTIDGIKTTVGEVKEGVTGNTESISKLEQANDEIYAEVGRVEKEFNEDSGAKLLRDNISIATLGLQSVLGIFASDMNTYMEDNKLSESEKEEIAIYKEKVINEKLALNTQLDILIKALEGNGQKDKASTLTRAKELLNTSANNLLNNIDTACADGVFTNMEMATIVSYFGNFNSKINEIKNLVDEYIFVSIGGNLVEELANFIMKQNQIKLSVSRTESALKNSLNLSKSLVQGIISSNDTALVSFKNCFSTISSDRTITSEEVDSLNVRITTMDERIVDIETKKEEIANDPMLSEEEKQRLLDAYNTFIASFNSLKEKTNNAIADGIINDVELLEVNEAVNNYYNELDNIHSRLCQALDDIENKTTSQEIQNVKSEMNIEINQLNGKIDDLETNFEDTIMSGYIDAQEKENILQNLAILEREKIDVDNRFNQWYGSNFLYGDLKETYKQVYDDYVTKYEALVNLANTIANKTDLVSDAERLAIENAYNELLIALNIFFKQSEIVIDVATSNENIYIKDNLSKDFSDINNAINDLNIQMNEAFKDSIITEIELKNIETLLIQIDKERLDIEKTYNELYNNSNLQYVSSNLFTIIVNK